MAARGHFVFPIDDKNHRVLVIWDLNGYCMANIRNRSVSANMNLIGGPDRCICDKVMACTG